MITKDAMGLATGSVIGGVLSDPDRLGFAEDKTLLFTQHKCTIFVVYIMIIYTYF